MWPWGVTREKYCHDLAALESKFSGINIDGICVPLEMREAVSNDDDEWTWKQRRWRKYRKARKDRRQAERKVRARR